jgi:hypothetical protein
VHLGKGPIRTMRILVLALMAALFVIGAAIPPALSSGSRHRTGGSVSPWPYLVVIVFGVNAVVAIAVAGYRVPAFSPGPADAASRSRAVAAFQQSLMLRFALAESVAIVSIALTFAAHPTSFSIYLLGAAISLVLMLVHVWPSQRVVLRIQTELDRDDGRSELSAALHGVPG